MSFDMNKLMQQAAAMQKQMQRMQEDAKKETAEASVGGGMVKVTANGAGGGRGEGAEDDRRARLGRYRSARPRWVTVRDWVWGALVLVLIGIVVWGWAFDFAR